MTALHVTNTVNAEATLNQWLMTTINALDKPAWLPTFVFVFDAPETTLALPSFSVYHLPVSDSKKWQGDNTGGTSKGVWSVSLMDVSCWVTRGNANWSAQLRTMRAFVGQVYASNRVIQVVDHLTDPDNPVAVSFLIRLESMEWDRMVVSDKNPDIERERALIRYSWIQRS